MTRGFPLAMAANANNFPDGGGYRVPVRTAGVVTYEVQPDERLGLGSVPGATDVVCFRSRAADATGFHSLVATDVDVQPSHAWITPNRTPNRQHQPQPSTPTPTHNLTRCTGCRRSPGSRSPVSTRQARGRRCRA